MTATDGGSIASIVNDSRAAPELDIPCPRAIEVSIELFGMEAFFALDIARASRGLNLGSGPYTVGS